MRNFFIQHTENSISNSKKGDNMHDYEEEEFFDNQVESVRLDADDEDDDDPKGTAFMRGVEEAVQIREATEEDEEEF